MENELEVKLINEKCKNCPRLELETIDFWIGRTKQHRCKNLQFCREVLGYWKNENNIDELKIEEWSE